MWARVVRLPGGTAPDFPDLIRAAVAAQVPITLSSPGNRGVVALVDPASSMMLTITLWQTLDDLMSTGVQMRGVVEGLEASTGAPHGAGEISPWKVVVCDVPARLGPERHLEDEPSRLCARMVVVRGDPGPDLVKRARFAYAALRSSFFETPGFLSGLALADPGTGRLLTCGLWAGRDELVAAADRIRGWTQGFAISVGAEPGAATALWDVLACDVPVRILTDEDDPDP